MEKNFGGIPVRPFGRTGLKQPIIGLGGGHIVNKFLSRAQQVRLVQRAVDEGITFLDNAWEYGEGEAERRMGEALTGGRRDRVFLMTKVCARDRKGAERQLHDSLRKLRTEVIDLWQFHEVNYDNDPDWIFGARGAIRAAEAARRAGKVRFIGFTGHKSPHIHRAMLEREFAWDAVMMPVTVLDPHYRSFLGGVLPQLNRRGIASIGMKSLGGGGQFVRDAGLTPRECRGFALSQPISTLVVGVATERDLRQELEIARAFTPMSRARQARLLRRVEARATDGRHEWYKSSQFYDSVVHRDQHGFPPVRAIN